MSFCHCVASWGGRGLVLSSRGVGGSWCRFGVASWGGRRLVSSPRRRVGWPAPRVVAAWPRGVGGASFRLCVVVWGGRLLVLSLRGLVGSAVPRFVVTSSGGVAGLSIRRSAGSSSHPVGFGMDGEPSSSFSRPWGARKRWGPSEDGGGAHAASAGLPAWFSQREGGGGALAASCCATLVLLGGGAQ